MSHASIVLNALAHGVAFRDRSDRLRLRVTGSDRVRLLHNLTTNDVNALKPGESCEAFVTSPQGKTLALVTIHAEPDALLVRADRACAEHLLPHFQKYGALDDAGFEDLSESTGELHFTMSANQAGLQLPSDSAAGGVWEPGPFGIRTFDEMPLGVRGRTVVADRKQIPGLVQLLELMSGDELPVVELTESDWEALRIEAGTPVYGRDITPANLPQEVARDELAINFRKGCYLGQETVARIDALGHVNRIVRRFVGRESTTFEAGATLWAEGKSVGTITSAARSLRTGEAIGLGYVRIAFAESGTRLRLGESGSGAGVEVLTPRSTT